MISRIKNRRKAGKPKNMERAIARVCAMPVQLRQLRRIAARFRGAIDMLIEGHETILERLDAAPPPQQGAPAEAADTLAMYECIQRQAQALSGLSRERVANDLLVPLGRHVVRQIFNIHELRRTGTASHADTQSILMLAEQGLWDLLGLWGLGRIDEPVGAAFDYRTMQAVARIPSSGGQEPWRVRCSLRPGLVYGQRVLEHQLVEIESTLMTNKVPAGSPSTPAVLAR